MRRVALEVNPQYYTHMNSDERPGMPERCFRLRRQAAENLNKWGKQDLETLGLAIAEETGELCQAILQHRHEDCTKQRIFEEAVDLGALSLQVMHLLERPLEASACMGDFLAANETPPPNDSPSPVWSLLSTTSLTPERGSWGPHVATDGEKFRLEDHNPGQYPKVWIGENGQPLLFDSAAEATHFNQRRL